MVPGQRVARTLYANRQKVFWQGNFAGIFKTDPTTRLGVLQPIIYMMCMMCIMLGVPFMLGGNAVNKFKHT